jgi:hypothetical protein
MGANMAKESGMNAASIQRIYAARAAAANAGAERKFRMPEKANDKSAEADDASGEGGNAESYTSSHEDDKPNGEEEARKAGDTTPSSSLAAPTNGDSTEDQDDTAKRPRSNADDNPDAKGDFCDAVYRAVASKAKLGASRAKEAAIHVKDTIVDAVETVKKLGVKGTAGAIANCVRDHPWETAAIVLPLLVLAIIAIALSAADFGADGIAAGM